MSEKSTSPSDGEDEDEGLTVVNSRDQIPHFANEAEAREFWQTHSVGPGLLTYQPPRRRPSPTGQRTPRQ